MEPNDSTNQKKPGVSRTPKEPVANSTTSANHIKLLITRLNTAKQQSQNRTLHKQCNKSLPVPAPASCNNVHPSGAPAKRISLGSLSELEKLFLSNTEHVVPGITTQAFDKTRRDKHHSKNSSSDGIKCNQTSRISRDTIHQQEFNMKVSHAITNRKVSSVNGSMSDMTRERTTGEEKFKSPTGAQSVSEVRPMQQPVCANSGTVVGDRVRSLISRLNAAKKRGNSRNMSNGKNRSLPLLPSWNMSSLDRQAPCNKTGTAVSLSSLPDLEMFFLSNPERGLLHETHRESKACGGESREEVALPGEAGDVCSEDDVLGRGVTEPSSSDVTETLIQEDSSCPLSKHGEGLMPTASNGTKAGTSSEEYSKQVCASTQRTKQARKDDTCAKELERPESRTSAENSDRINIQKSVSKTPKLVTTRTVKAQTKRTTPKSKLTTTSKDCIKKSGVKKVATAMTSETIAKKTSQKHRKSNTTEAAKVPAKKPPVDKTHKSTCKAAKSQSKMKSNTINPKHKGQIRCQRSNPTSTQNKQKPDKAHKSTSTAAKLKPRPTTNTANLENKRQVGGKARSSATTVRKKRKSDIVGGADVSRSKKMAMSEGTALSHDSIFTLSELEHVSNTLVPLDEIICLEKRLNCDHITMPSQRVCCSLERPGSLGLGSIFNSKLHPGGIWKSIVDEN